MESGGTLTERTGDSGLALDKAVRQLSCTYTLGLQSTLTPGQRHRLSVRVKGGGLRALHAAAYLPRSEGVKRESLIRAAYFSPESFETGELHAALQPLEPRSRDTWKAQLGLGFQMHDTEAEFGAVVMRGDEVVHRVARSIKGGPGVSVVFLEPVSLRAGSYAVTSVIVDSTAALPRSVKVLLELPPLPARGPFLVAPVLGRLEASARVVRAGLDASGDRPGAFEPLLSPELPAPTDLLVRTEVCSLDGASASPKIARSLRSSSGTVLQALDPVAVALEKREGAWCGEVTDAIPAAELSPGEAYVFEARFAEDSRRSAATTRFLVGPAPR